MSDEPYEQTLPEPPTLAGQRVALASSLAGMSKREAARLIREHGGTYVEKPDAACTLIVWGEAEVPVTADSSISDLWDEATQKAVEDGTLQCIRETELWQRMKLVELEQNVHRLYTPAMLAELLGVSVAVIRRWHRRGLILPAKEVHRLPYFDFCEVSNARRLAELLSEGCSPAEIEKQLAGLQRYLPTVERPLAQLSVIVQDKRLLLRQGDGLIEPGGQYRIDFDAAESESPPPTTELLDSEETTELSFEAAAAIAELNSPEAMCEAAEELEDQDHLREAKEMYRAALVAGGPDAETNFRLAELLYRTGETSAARERYYMALEINEDFVEARANLGCVLAEQGELDLAVAAFQGALEFHQEYPDVHYHLARTLDEQGNAEAAKAHWETFLQLAGSSPWAEEAKARLSE